jgi:ankyrin repeat protein
MTDALFCYSSYYFEEDLSQLKLLLELGVDLNARNAKGITAIHVALQSSRNSKIVQFYMDNKVQLP